MWLQATKYLLLVLPALIVGLGQKPVISFEDGEGSLLLASGSSSPTIIVDQDDSPSVIRAATDLAIDFGRVTGVNGSVANASAKATSFSGTILLGTVDTPLIRRLIESSSIDISSIEGQWEAFTTVVTANPLPGLGQVLVIIGSLLPRAASEAHSVQEAIVAAQSMAFTTCQNRLAFRPIISGLMSRRRHTNVSSP